MDFQDAYLFHQGTNFNTYNYLGANFVKRDSVDGVVFRVWAYNAVSVSVIGDFNLWGKKNNGKMEKVTEQGIWEVFIPKLVQFQAYKFLIKTKDKRLLYKSDPYAFHSETDGKTASKIYDLKDAFKWTDDNFIAYRNKTDMYSSPLNIYELHAGSWKKYADGNRYDYKKLADELLPYIKELGYTHVELMPVMEHPFDGSWGYQITGYYSVTSRFGTPADFMYFINKFHNEGIGVILDWVPGHFPKDENGLAEFDGGYLYECQDINRMEHAGWGTRTFDFGRPEVQSFLISNAVFWFEKFHIDGLRVDAIASMIYLDYDRKPGQWTPNFHGGRENLEAVAFLQKLNTEVFSRFPKALMIAEESTAFANVTKPVHCGGLGFNYKWNMGWMNDILEYLSTDPVYRVGKHNKLTFSLMYAFSENYILPISHDEVVHGKRSLVDKMYGSYEEKFATLRAFYALMASHPGKKLLFMGCEFAQFREWDYANELEFFMLGYDMHSKTKEFVRQLNNFYLQTPCLWEIDFSWDGFAWIISDDKENNIVVYKRMDKAGKEIIIAINFAPVLRTNYCFNCKEGTYLEIFNTDNTQFGGKGFTNGILITTENLTQCENTENLEQGDNIDKNENAKQSSHFLSVTLPPLSALFLEHQEKKIFKI